MSYEIKPTYFFLQQLEKLSDKSIDLIKEKLKLIKENPFRYKRIYGYKLFLFRIRFEDRSKEKRVIYLVDNKTIKMLCILDREKEYKDLKKYLKKAGCL